MRGAGLFQNVSPDHGFEAGNPDAGTLEPLPFVFLGEECTYNRPFRASPHLAGLPLADPHRTGGCSFCVRPPVGRPWKTPPAELLQRQLAAIDRTLPGTSDRGLRIRLLGEQALRHPADVAREALRFRRRPLSLLLDGRADRLLAVGGALRAALRRLEGSGVRLELCLLGAESFSSAELERFNKGLRPETTLRALRLLLELEREFPAGFGFREHGGLSLITMTPWTTPAELALNLAVVGALGIEELVGKLFTGRLRLLPGLPLVEAARRDGLLVARYRDPLLDTARRNLYAPEIPWRFAYPEMETLSRVLVRLDPDAAGGVDPLSRRVAAMEDVLGRGVTARSVAAALAMVDAAMSAAVSGKVLSPAALLRAIVGAGPRADEDPPPPRRVAWVRHADWSGRGARARGRLPLKVLLAHKPVLKVEPLSEAESRRFERDPDLPNVRARPRSSRFGREGWEVFLGRKLRDVAAGVKTTDRIEQGRPGPELRADVVRMGVLLGYPRCCARAFADEPPLMVQRVLAARGAASPDRAACRPSEPLVSVASVLVTYRASAARPEASPRVGRAGPQHRALSPTLLCARSGQAVELVPEETPGDVSTTARKRRAPAWTRCAAATKSSWRTSGRSCCGADGRWSGCRRARSSGGTSGRCRRGSGRRWSMSCGRATRRAFRRRRPSTSRRPRSSGTPRSCWAVGSGAGRGSRDSPPSRGPRTARSVCASF